MALVATPVAEALAGIRANRAKGVPTFVISKNPKAVPVKGTTFYTLTATYDGKVSCGFYDARDIRISKSYANPRDKDDKRNDFEKLRMQFDTTANDAGVLGEFLVEVEVEWQSAVATAIRDGVIVLGKQDVHGIVSKGSKVDATKFASNPFISIKIPQGTYSPKHPIAELRGKPKCELVANDKFIVIEKNGKKKPVNAPLLAADGSPAVDANLHTVICTGTILNRLRFEMNSVPLSTTFLSLKIEANKVWITPGDPDAGAFGDDADNCSAADMAALGLGAAAPARASAEPAVAAAAAQPHAESDDEPDGKDSDDDNGAGAD